MILFIMTNSKQPIWYISCPAGVRTGGPEALHQLAHALKHYNIRVEIIFFEFDVSLRQYSSVIQHDVNIVSEYEQYDVTLQKKLLMQKKI